MHCLESAWVLVVAAAGSRVRGTFSSKMVGRGLFCHVQCWWIPGALWVVLYNIVTNKVLIVGVCDLAVAVPIIGVCRMVGITLRGVQVATRGGGVFSTLSPGVFARISVSH